jgi:hypothetical protein
MSKLTTHQIRDEARKIVATSKGGIRYGDLLDQISTPNPETPKNTIHGSIWDLHIRYPQEIGKPSRGLFVPMSSTPGGPTTPVEPEEPPVAFKEADFYESFADWLKNDLDEVTDAAAMGGRC